MDSSPCRMARRPAPIRGVSCAVAPGQGRRAVAADRRRRTGSGPGSALPLRPYLLSSFPSHVMRPRGKKRPRGGTVVNFGAYADSGGGNEVGLDLVLRARSVVGPETLRAPRMVATGRKAPEHD